MHRILVVILVLASSIIMYSAALHSDKFEDISLSQDITTRAMYVNGFATIIGDNNLENDLLAFAQSHDITTLLLYELHTVNNNHDLTDPATNGILADFISKAKTDYGIQNIGATAENGNFFTNIIDAYNNSRSLAEEKFDIYNLEFEFWISGPTGPGGYYCTTYLTPNGLPCTIAGAFQFFMTVLQTMNSLADNNSHPITTEAYVGWPTASQAATIGANLDKLRLHAYVSDPNSAFGYADDRMIDFANGTPDLDVSIIFSSEPNFMQSWLEDHSLTEAEDIFTEDWEAGSAGWNENVNLVEYTYFVYSDMTNIPDEICPNTNVVKDLTIDVDTTIYAKCQIVLNNVVVQDPYQLTLFAPEVCIDTISEVLLGAKFLADDGDCPNN